MAQGKQVSWSSEMDALLGTAPDKVVGKQLGICGATVLYRRIEQGIPSYGTPKTKWTPEMDALLGTASDAKVAARLGLLRGGIVRRRRNTLRIPSWKSQTRVLPEGVSRDSPEGERFHTRRRRHKVRGALDTLTLEEWKSACKYFDHCCAYCGKRAFLTEDHLIPLSKGGPRTVLNIVPACWRCNMSKSNRRAHIWIYETFGIEQGKKVVERVVVYLREVSDE